MTRRNARAAFASALLAGASHALLCGPANALGIMAPGRDAVIELSIAEAALRFGLPADWIRAVIRAESGGDALALSRAGAVGLMQLMPGTYADLRSRYGLGADPYGIRDNILAGSAYLRELRDRYGPLGMLAAYNAGPGRWDEHVRTGRPLPDETERYLAKLSSAVGLPTLDPALAAGPGETARQQTDTLFARRGGRPAAAQGTAAGRRSAGVPARRPRAGDAPTLFVMVTGSAARQQGSTPDAAKSLAPPGPAARSASRARRLSAARSPTLSGRLFVPRDPGQPAS